MVHPNKTDNIHIISKTIPDKEPYQIYGLVVLGANFRQPVSSPFHPVEL